VIQVLIAASSVVMRAGLEALLSNSPSLNVVGSLADSTTLPEQIETLQPDVVLMELAAQEDEPASLATIDLNLHTPAIVLLVDELQANWLSDLLRSGVRGIIPTDATAGEIVATIEAVGAGLVTLHPDVVTALLPVMPSAGRALPENPTQALTPREIEVLGMLAEGSGNKTIARKLGISEHTVKFHVASIFSKLNVSSRTEAVTIGARQGLILL
jgi:two-component system, NarL family, response regulator YdfI